MTLVRTAKLDLPQILLGISTERPRTHDTSGLQLCYYQAHASVEKTLKRALEMAGKAHGATRRLLKELQNYERDPSEALLHLAPTHDDDLMHWTAVLKGVNGTAYEGGLWQLDIQIPDAYPNSPPSIRFVTPICHPNVHFKTGEICLDLLKTAWSPAYTIASTLNSVHQLLTSAEPDSPLNIDIAQLFRQGDQIGAEALIRFYTETERWQVR